MKNLLFVSSIYLFCVSCSNFSSQETVKDFVPGTYVSKFNDSIYENTNVAGDDTLRIRKQTESGSETFQIDRTTRIERIADGKRQPEELRKNSWTGSFRAEDKTVFVNNTGAVLAFDIKNGLLKMGEIEFRKIE